MPTEVYRSLESLGPFRDKWRRLAGEKTCNQPDWQFAWIEHAMPSQSELTTILCTDDSHRLLAVLPLYFDKAKRVLHGIAQFPGAHCTYEILENDAGADIDAVQEITRILLCEKRDWKALQLEAVPLASSSMQRWYAHLLSQKFHVIKSQPRMAYRIEFHDGLESWLNQCAPKTQSLFEQCCVIHDSMRARWVHDGHDWSEFLETLFELLDQSIPYGKKVVLTPAQREWIRQGGKELLARNQLQAFSLWRDNKPVFAEFGIRTKSIWYRCLHATSTEAMARETDSHLNAEDVLIAYATRHAERFGITTIQFAPNTASSFLASLCPVPLENWTVTHPGWIGSASATWIRCRTKWNSWLNRFGKADKRPEPS